MKTRICKYDTYQIKINGEWIGLVCCKNCKTIMGVHESFTKSSKANKIKCCEIPDIIWGYSKDTKNEATEPTKKFFEKHKDMLIKRKM